MKRVAVAVAGGLVAGAANWGRGLWPLAWLGVAAIAFALAREERRRTRLTAAYASQVAWLVACAPYLPSTLRLTGVTSSETGSLAYATAIWAGASLFMAAPIAAAAELRKRLPACLWLPPAWLIGEKIRDHFGRWSIDWLYSQWSFGPMLAALALLGWWLTAWAGLFVSSALGDAVARRSVKWLAPVALVVGFALLPRPRGGASFDGIGVVTLASAEPPPTVPEGGLRLLVWPEGSLSHAPLLAEGKPSVPETIMPPRRGSFEHVLGVVGRLRGAAGKRVPLLNAAVALEPDGGVVGVRGKSGLFPITEEPLFGVVGDASRSTMAVGTAEPLLLAGGRKVVPIICVEAMRRSLAARGVAAGGELIAILSSDIGLRESRIGRDEMLAVAVMRAVENGVGVVRASLDGASAIIDRDGTVLAVSIAGAPGILRVGAPVPSPPPTADTTVLVESRRPELALACPKGRCELDDVAAPQCDHPTGVVVVSGHSDPPTYLGVSADTLASAVACRRPKLVVLDTCWGASLPLFEALVKKGVTARVVAAAFYLPEHGLAYGDTFWSGADPAGVTSPHASWPLTNTTLDPARIEAWNAAVEAMPKAELRAHLRHTAPNYVVVGEGSESVTALVPAERFR